MSCAPLLIVVTGPPGAGKTTVAREIAARLRLPLLEKDTIKEGLFDGLGAGDLEWSKRLGAATFVVLYRLVAESLRAGASLVVEANFVRGASEERFAELPPARIVQVHCGAEVGVLLERYGSRERHPGHVDGERLDDVRNAIEAGRHDPLDLPGQTIRLDTTEPLVPESLVARVQRAALWSEVGAAILASPGADAIARGDDPPELAALLDKVRGHAYRIVDADVAGLDAGRLYEVVLAAAWAAADAERRRAHEAIG
jgi:predicted kinase